MTGAREVADLALELEAALDPAEPAHVQIASMADAARIASRAWRSESTNAADSLRDLAVALDRLAEEVKS